MDGMLVHRSVVPAVNWPEVFLLSPEWDASSIQVERFIGRGGGGGGGGGGVKKGGGIYFF